MLIGDYLSRPRVGVAIVLINNFHLGFEGRFSDSKENISSLIISLIFSSESLLALFFNRQVEGLKLSYDNEDVPGAR